MRRPWPQRERPKWAPGPSWASFLPPRPLGPWAGLVQDPFYAAPWEGGPQSQLAPCPDLSPNPAWLPAQNCEALERLPSVHAGLCGVQGLWDWSVNCPRRSLPQVPPPDHAAGQRPRSGRAPGRSAAVGGLHVPGQAGMTGGEPAASSRPFHTPWVWRPHLSGKADTLTGDPA